MMRGACVHPVWRSLALALALVATAVAAAERFDRVYISECAAVSTRGRKGGDGERPGWVELHNGGGAAANLRGWFLTDSVTNLTQWKFPHVVLLPGKELVVFASGRNFTNNLAPLHASFRLAPEGGTLFLVNPATNVVSALKYPALGAGVSFGSVRGEPAWRGVFQKPTPGKPNVSSGAGFSSEVIFSHPGGTFTNQITLALSCSVTNAVIRYTRDGSLPDSTAAVYAAPFLLTNSAHLRARAYQPGLLPGPPASAAFLRLASNALAFTSSLPVLVLDTFGRDIRVSPQGSFVHATLFEPVNGFTSLTGAPALTTRAGFRYRGSTSAGFAQQPLALEFLDEFNEERALGLLGLPADSDWILYAPNPYDPVMIHNPFVHQLSRDMGRYSPRTRFVEVFFTRSVGPIRQSHYHGLYVLTEKIKIGPHRVNIDKADGDDLKPPKVTGGYLMKFDRVGEGEGGFAADNGRGLVYVEPKEETMDVPQRAPQREYLWSFFGEFERALQGPHWRDPVRGYPAYLDVEAAIDFHVLELLSGNVDALVLSTYFHKPRGGRITFGPHWDFDRALGSIDERDAYPRQWITGPFFGGQWWPRLFSDPDFWQLWVDRWQELRGSHFALTNLSRLIDQLCAEVREAQPREYDRWGLQPRGGSYDGEIRHMKDWLSNRIDFIDAQLTPPPILHRPPGAPLVLTAGTNATIYYTLDGSDPRLPQGVVSSNALVYTKAVPLPATARVVARAHDKARQQHGGPPVSTPWSRRVVSAPP